MTQTYSPAWFRAHGMAAASVATILVLGVYLLRLDAVAGLVVDDGWYVLLAKSLASGEGYGLVNSPTPGGLTPYPPGFPAILASVFWLNPNFPENVWLLKSVSVAAMMGVGVVSYRYFALECLLPTWLALGIAVATVITPGFVFLATSTVMSECVFTLTQLAAVLFLDRSVRGDHPRRDTLLAAALTAGTVLMRSAGVALVAAGVFYLLSQRLWRRTALFVAAVLVCLAPWMAYARLHAPTMAERLDHGGGHAFTYVQNFWMKRAGLPSSGSITVGGLPARVANNLIDVFGRDIGALVVPSLYRTASESGEEVLALGGGPYPASMGSAAGTMVVSLALGGVAMLGFVAVARRRPSAAEFLVPLSLGLTVVWPSWAYRFVLPLTPFLIFYLMAGIRQLTPAAPVLRIGLLCVIALNVIDHAQYVLARRTQVVDWAADAAEAESVIAWMQQHLPAGGHVATSNPPLIFLRTGRRTVAIDDPATNWHKWKSRGVRYLVSLRRTGLPARYGPYKVLYRSPQHGLWIIEI